MLPSHQANGLRLAPALHDREGQRVRDDARAEFVATFRALFLTEPSGRLLARLDTLSNERFRGFVMAGPDHADDYYTVSRGRELAHETVVRLFDLATLDAAWPA